ncbi:SCO6880 family protein [Streptomyces sp. NPDC060048]|uniref:SCO6880 family protein n=1 Tax=unclassified Streptomyces TaxID=2593676 RepID=UPI003699A5D8
MRERRARPPLAPKSVRMIGAGALGSHTLLATTHPVSLLVTVPVTLSVPGLTAAGRHGMPALSHHRARVAWKLATWAEATNKRRVLLPHPYALDPPGVAAPMTLIAAYDPTTGRQVEVVHDRATGYMTVSTLLAPGGSLVAPTGTVRGNLRSWSSLLDAMSTDEQIEGASVTIQIQDQSAVRSVLAGRVRKRRQGRPGGCRPALCLLAGQAETPARFRTAVISSSGSAGLAPALEASSGT